jgi:hypothetical protein
LILYDCEHCGRENEVPEEYAEKEVKCIYCKELFVVPKLEEARKKEGLLGELIEKGKEEVLRQKEDLKDGFSDEEKEEYKRRWFVPEYDEVVLCCMSFAFIFLYIFSSVMRSNINRLVMKGLGSNEKTLVFYTAIGLLCIFGGMFFSIYHAFTKKDKGLGAKLAMLFWAIAISAGTGIYSGYVMIRYPSPSGWLIIRYKEYK